jgi:hypothetical protein
MAEAAQGGGVGRPVRGGGAGAATTTARDLGRHRRAPCGGIRRSSIFSAAHNFSLLSSPRCNGAGENLPDAKWGRASRSAHPGVRSIWHERDGNGTSRGLWGTPVQRFGALPAYCMSRTVAGSAPSATSLMGRCGHEDDVRAVRG